ncbi:recombinase family protein [Agarilytica rhodophyticola]|uniref:recombinase family protein n=1 Tax=Agarilytica rhodophyticola TaxID=1737490 RepID=UPI000CD99155|nr:recombinase family protein [Agarilytica rhodophyticola]
MSKHVIPKRRCAVYTRKSHEEGLDQDYNSIDAQKDAGHAYITAHRSEGWISVNDNYDDPAYSGGTLERPALKRLMRDIEEDKIDTVVVYKIDRLTRSLHDFSQLVEIFERMNVSFVSVTQEFNTTSSMGRLMLNILLSFAQFEREVTAERIRDKVASSKRKGLWMGGIPPLGYDVKDRLLVVNSNEAKTVRHIFSRFLEIGSATLLVKELRLDGISTKSWTTKDNKYRPGKLIDKGFIYKLFQNRTYLGEIGHKGQWYEGKHDAIIDKTLWEAVHKKLADSYKAKGNNTRAKVPFLLKGLLFDTEGRALTTSFANSRHKNGKRYRYYLSIRDAKEGAGTSDLTRFPASELETAVTTQVMTLLKSSEIVKEVTTIAQVHDDELDEAMVAVALTKMTTLWEQLFPDEQARLIHLMIEKIIITPNAMDLRLRKNGLEQLAQEITPETLKKKVVNG